MSNGTVKVRGFELANGYHYTSELPIQMTGKSAGYDFECAEEVTIYPIWKHIFTNIGTLLALPKEVALGGSIADLDKLIKPTLVKTGIKAYMRDDEALFLYNRSSNPLKKRLILANGTGVIDADYYGNEGNDGHIMFQFINFGMFPVTFKKGERVGQGIFQPILRADEGKHRKDDSIRSGGFGSSN
jgi:dUTP pyrophosphatase